MYEMKTKVNDNDVKEFIQRVENPKKREDGYRLLDIFTETTGLEGKMWGESIIGFGSYHYKYPSGHEGDTAITGFSPRKAKISLYLALWDTECEELLKDFGKHTKGKVCVYTNKLSDINVEVLQKLIKRTVIVVKEAYPENP